MRVKSRNTQKLAAPPCYVSKLTFSKHLYQQNVQNCKINVRVKICHLKVDGFVLNMPLYLAMVRWRLRTNVKQLLSTQSSQILHHTQHLNHTLLHTHTDRFLVVPVVAMKVPVEMVAGRGVWDVGRERVSVQ